MHRDEQTNGDPKPRRPKRSGAGPLGPARTPSDRPAQVASEIRRALQTELGRGLSDPRVQGMVSVTEVLLAPDFSLARVRVSVMPADRASLTVSGLRAAAGFLRRRVMDETRISRVPRLEFELDESLKRQAALDAAIREGGGEAAPGASEQPRRRGGDVGQAAENAEEQRDEG